jgi:hypothetical protein
MTTDSFTPVTRALVAAALLLATTALMVVTVSTARATGALAIGGCGAYGQAFDFSTAAEARRSALANCTGRDCRVVAVVKRGCAALAVDFVSGCGAQGWGRAPTLGRAENAALKECYREGGRECVIRTFFCDAKG